MRMIGCCLVFAFLSVFSLLQYSWLSATSIETSPSPCCPSPHLSSHGVVMALCSSWLTLDVWQTRNCCRVINAFIHSFVSLKHYDTVIIYNWEIMEFLFFNNTQIIWNTILKINCRLIKKWIRECIFFYSFQIE